MCQLKARSSAVSTLQNKTKNKKTHNNKQKETPPGLAPFYVIAIVTEFGVVRHNVLWDIEDC